MKEDMRGLFSIIKGQYSNKTGEGFSNDINNTTMYIGGYDPYSPDTTEWYQAMDNVNFKCIGCGGDYNKVLRSVYNTIKHHKGSVKNYLKHTKNTPATPPITRSLYERVIKEYGAYFSDDILDMEDLAYSELREDTPLKKTKKLVKKIRCEDTSNTTTNSVKVLDNMTPKKLVKTKPKLGIKKLSMN